jgi:hypothetical protein
LFTKHEYTLWLISSSTAVPLTIHRDGSCSDQGYVGAIPATVRLRRATKGYRKAAKKLFCVGYRQAWRARTRGE